MRRVLTKVGSLAAVSMLAVALAQPAQAAQPTASVRPADATAPAYFEFTDSSDTMVIQLTDPAKIQEARNILSGAQTDPTHIMGTIVKSPAPYNQPWNFTLDPNSITFFSMAMEACDGNIAFANANLDQVGGSLFPHSTFCPWHSQLTREIPAPSGS
ncbi:calmodulin-binding protein [Kitasatospora sp. NPDC008050]|uniref:BP74-related protein n=1 Tax=Kitasatospora sp. NPDC008050 TaxID=3364021 RepID=UPI0036E7F4BC